MTEQKHLCYNCFQEREAPEGPCPYCGFDLAENEKKFPVALRAGTVLNDRYIIGRVLGQGGFGITYLALDTQLNAKVAIKEFMPNDIATRIGTTVSVAMDTKSEEFAYGAERFQEEARTLAKFIGNPNIAAVTSYFDENDTSYFVMDYIEGISFKTYIANHGGKISVEETLNVMIPVLRALTAVHAEGFIHRDVTPDNIYITKDGIVKLLDFGSARYSIGDKSKSLDVILKVGYAPKEQYIRRSRQGPFTDVYSCAACFYAAITGFLPPESLERLDEDTLVPISQCGIDIPEYLDKAILKGLAVQPEDRFQSAAEFLDAIESRQVVEVPVSGAAAPAPEKKKVKPARIAAIAAAAVVVLGVGIAIGGGGSSDGDGGSSISEALAPKVTIAGQEFSAAEEFVELKDTTLTEADITTLQGMENLRRIYFDNVTVENNDLSWAAQLKNLTELTFNGFSGEVDLAPVAGLTNLTELRIHSTQNGAGSGVYVKDLSVLSGLTQLEYLELEAPVLESLDGLEDMSALEELRLTIGPGLRDIGALSGLTELTSLQISNNGDYPYIRDLSPLSGLTQLKTLEFWSYGIEDLAPLAGLTQLEELRIIGSEAAYTTTAPLSGLTQLRVLSLPSMADPANYLDLSGLSNLTELTEFSFYGGVTSYAPLKNLTKLQSLSLMGNYYDGEGPGDLSAFSGLTRLTDLELSLSVNATDITPLGNLSDLRSLYLHTEGDRLHPGLKDIGPLSKLQDLQSLTINSRSITDLSPLRELTNLQTADIRAYGDAEITDWSPVEHVPNLIKG
ncbi:protein kinase [Oscillibacter valericigenes]|uniref:Protein kinase n=1 Tax=Oscillibacter valericigenes TaxID=351091 RepID=A0ABS2FV91_9FIRM|nr:protein kinase [Oscillibacter valericigenes]MBM6851552.1 protein kinase [Oscillibacter valericigenes]